MTKYFKNWVKRMNKSFAFAKDYRLFSPDSKTVIVINICTGKSGIAKCHKKDVFERSIGTAIAYARCIGKPVPDMDFEPTKKNIKYHFIKYDKMLYKSVFDNQYTYDELVKYDLFIGSQEKLNNELKKSNTDSFVYRNSNNYLVIISLVK